MIKKKIKRLSTCVNCNYNHFLIFDKYYFGRRLNINNILVCNICGLKQSDYLPDSNRLKLFYNEINTKLLFDYSKTDKPKDKYFNKFDSFFSYILKKTKLNIDHKANILDIGAGNGRVLLQIRDLTKWNSLGLEPDETKFKILNYLKLNAINDIFQNTSKSMDNNNFDLIIMSQVLEHISNPIAILNEINKKLKKGGYLWIDVPLCNNNYFKSRTNDYVGHLYFFDEVSLKNILIKNNFHIISRGSYGKKLPNNRGTLTTIKIFTKYILNKYLPLLIMNLNKNISMRKNKFKKIDLNKLYETENILINEENFEYQKLFYLVKK